jgi:hypothetical protein
MVHPLLLSLANIIADVQMKLLNHAFVLLTLLPVPKFISSNKKACGILRDRLIHTCLDFMLHPLKVGVAIRIMMSDPLGNQCFCFTPCVAYMVDTQEVVMLAGVAGKTSHLTMANYKQFSDPFCHQPQTVSIILMQHKAICIQADLTGDIAVFVCKVMKFQLNSVNKLFWHDWPGVEPSVFLTPEPLHHWHKYFWDHM